MELGVAARRLRVWTPIVACWVLLAGLPLALRPLLPVDETRYASVAWEMWQGGEFLVPYLNGKPYSDKPPLLFWLIHLGWQAFGVSEWWPRLVPPLFSLANLVLTAALARRLWPDRPALARTAPAILVGLLLWSVFTGMLMFDMLLATCVLLALLGLIGAWRSGGVLPWLQLGAALGLGVLAKGPVALVAPLTVAALARWWGSRRPGRRWWLGLFGALGVAQAIALSWALPAAHTGGPEYARAILVSQTEERVIHSLAHQRSWWWYLALLPVLLYPYALWPPLWQALGRLRLRAADLGTRFCLAWTFPALAVFSLISGKQPHYLLPLLPGFALLAARLLDGSATNVRRWMVSPAAGFILLVAATLAAIPLLGQRPGLAPWTAEISPLTSPLLAVAGFVGLVFSPRIFRGRPAAPTLFSLILVTVLSLGGAEAIRNAYDVAPLGRYLAAAQREGRPVAFVGHYHGDFQFLGRLERPLEQIPPGAEWHWIAGHPRGKVVQDLETLLPGTIRAELTQPYRGEILVVWGRESILPNSFWAFPGSS